MPKCLNISVLDLNNETVLLDMSWTVCLYPHHHPKNSYVEVLPHPQSLRMQLYLEMEMVKLKRGY